MPALLLDDARRPVVLGTRLGRGGEGEVFEVQGQPALVAKVFLPSRRDRAKAEKLRAMLATPPAGAHDLVESLPVLTWPRGLLHDSRGDVVGYLMPRVAPRDFVPLFQLTTASRRTGMGTLSWEHLLLVGLRLCHVVRTLHRFGYAVGDLNDRNVLVSRRLTPLLMDTDSFQVPKRLGHHPSVVGDALYWPPELLDVDLATYRGSRVAGDRYALGVLLFQLFMDGWRPYQSRGSLVAGLETLAEKTRAGHYPWAKPKRGVLEPPAAAPDYARLPKPIRQAFERCFVAGHHHASRRPTADDWYEILTQVRARGVQSPVAAPASKPMRVPVPPRVRPRVVVQPTRPRGSKGPPLAALPQEARAARTKREPAAKRPRPVTGRSRRPAAQPARLFRARRVGWIAWGILAGGAGLLALTTL